MIPNECKRLAEVDFPVALVSQHAAQEKSIRHGHPATLHLWWARRPLAACRAMLLGLLLPDPADPLCPREFTENARAILAPILSGVGPAGTELRAALLRFIGDFADWDRAMSPAYLAAARQLVRMAHPVGPPCVVDPFAGGGSIPLEALRLGAEAFASDLNPVACLIQKVLLEHIPKHGAGLAAELRRAGAEVRRAAEPELAPFYPAGPDGGRPLVYLWARTVCCEATGCGAEVPLLRSFWLCKRPKHRLALRLNTRAIDGAPAGVIELFEPRTDREVPPGTVRRAKAVCQRCNAVLSPERVRAQLSQQHGGGEVQFDVRGNRVGGARLLAVLVERGDGRGRAYRLPTACDYQAVEAAARHLAAAGDASFPLGTALPLMSGTFNVPLYGMVHWGDLFSARQQLALRTLGSQVAAAARRAAAPALGEALALSVTRAADYCSTLCTWHVPKQLVRNTFGRQALPMTWDFCEMNPLADGPGSYAGAVEWIARVVEQFPSGTQAGQVALADACHSPLPDDLAAVWFTDPPYYFAVPYADLSDFFFLWLKEVLPDHPLLRDPFDATNPLTPKAAELCEMAHWDPVRYPHKDQAFFEQGMARAFAEGRRVLAPCGIGCVVFAAKSPAGWEALLSALIQAGWTITASWPIATEMGNRLRARDSAALATSVHLVCRPRPPTAPVGAWADVQDELPRRVRKWLPRLQAEGVNGADLIFACIGPALEVFSRYPRVETATGAEVKLGAYLARVWEVVGHIALEQVLDPAAALEEDARLTALFLATLREEPRPSPVRGLIFAADVLCHRAEALGIRLSSWEGRIIETKDGMVRLLPFVEVARPRTAKGGATTLDRVHAMMRLQSAGRSQALRARLREECRCGPAFLRLANALSALYPVGSAEKRLIDGMLLAAPR